MPKLKLLCDYDGLGLEGDIIEKPDAWINFKFRENGIRWEKYTGKIEAVAIASSEDSADVAYGKLSDGDKDSIRKGFKKLARRKAGWVLLDAINESSEEIHIMSLEQTKITKEGAIARAARENKILDQFRQILKMAIKGEDVNAVVEDYDQAEDLINKLCFKS